MTSTDREAQAAADQAGHESAPDAISPEEAAVTGANDQGDEAWIEATVRHLKSRGMIPEDAEVRYV